MMVASTTKFRVDRIRVSTAAFNHGEGDALPVLLLLSSCGGAEKCWHTFADTRLT
jgi:hypothetical protein